MTFCKGADVRALRSRNREAVMMATGNDLSRRGQDVDPFATVEQFLIQRIWMPHASCASWGWPRSASSRRSRDGRSLGSPEDSSNRCRRPDCRLEGRRASQAAIIRGSTLRLDCPFASDRRDHDRCLFSAARASGDSARIGEAAPSRRSRGLLPQSPPAGAAWPVRFSPACGKPKPPRRSICARRCCRLW